MKLQTHPHRHFPLGAAAHRRGGSYSTRLRRERKSFPVKPVVFKPASPITQPTEAKDSHLNENVLTSRQLLLLGYTHPKRFESHSFTVQSYVLATASQVYDEWTKYDALPHFMRGWCRADTPCESRCVWLIDFAGHEMVWEAAIDEQAPGQRIIWRGRGGRSYANHGSVYFHAVRPHICRITVEITFELPVEILCDDAFRDMEEKLRRTFASFAVFVLQQSLVQGSPVYYL